MIWTRTWTMQSALSAESAVQLLAEVKTGLLQRHDCLQTFSSHRPGDLFGAPQSWKGQQPRILRPKQATCHVPALVLNLMG